MTTLTAPEEACTAAASVPTAPRLRLRRAGRPERMIEIHDERCTIGSSPRCQVCLPAAEAKPLQCLLSLEAGVATVTRWAAGVLLNGREFSKQALRLGDRLSIGPWEIELDEAQEAAGVQTGERPTVDFKPAAVTAPAIPPKPLPQATAPVPSPPAPILPAFGLAPMSLAPALSPTRSSAPATQATAPASLTAPAIPAAPVVNLRPAAKTVLVASRLTDPYTDLLGPARPAPSTTLDASAPSLEPHLPVRSFTSHAFEDRLVVSLWTANFAARTRAKSLVAAAQTARNRVSELTAALGQTESLVRAARATTDSQAAESKLELGALRAQLAQAIADRDRLTAELDALRNASTKTLPPDPRLKTLADAVAVAERDAAELRTKLAVSQQQSDALREQGAAAEVARAAAEQQLAAQQSDQQLISDQRVAALQKDHAKLEADRLAWERERTLADQEAARLREQLYASESQIEILRERVAEADAAQTALAEQLTALEKQRSQWLAECQTLEQLRAAELAQVVAERDELQRQLDQLASTPAAAVHRTPAAPASAEPQTAPSWASTFAAPALGDDLRDESHDEAPFEAASHEDASVDDEDESPSTQPGWNLDTAPAAAEFDDQGDALATDSEWDAAPEAATWTPPTETVADEPLVPRSRKLPEPEPAPVPIAALAPTPISFIDKYRHLLEDDRESEPLPQQSRPILDDEYLSPSKFEPAKSTDEDSDEALEAYMSNMMRRVRGDGSVASQSIGAASTTSSDARRSAPSATPVLEAAPEQHAEAEPEIEVDANGMLRLVRKPHAQTDLTALRELANTSARTAIAHHRQRRRAESAVTKSIICVIAVAASAYLLLTAPDIQSPWFWGGCVALVAAAGTGVQLIGLAWQRLSDRRRYPHPPVSAVARVSPLEQADGSIASQF